MRTLIEKKLQEIEQKENITILHAVESGSRAWGFASPDSDYDVRFIYVRQPEYYLKLEKTRDVIELPINDKLDINGWDLNKTLRLLYKSNPTVFEWLSSPIIYRKTNFADDIQPLLSKYFTQQKIIYHYLGETTANYMTYINNHETVVAKKYFYVIRPLLAALYIMDKQSMAPIVFAELQEQYLDKSIEQDVNYLLDIKQNSPELKTIPTINTINNYVTETITKVKEYLRKNPDKTKHEWNDLNAFFNKTLNEHKKGK